MMEFCINVNIKNFLVLNISIIKIGLFFAKMHYYLCARENVLQSLFLYFIAFLFVCVYIFIYTHTHTHTYTYIKTNNIIYNDLFIDVIACLFYFLHSLSTSYFMENRLFFNILVIVKPKNINDLLAMR